MDKLKLIKLIFFADRMHLSRYGRPISGGQYFAMPHGPVCSELLDDIDERPGETKDFLDLEGYRVVATSQLDEDQLSESEIEVLERVNGEFGSLDTFHLRDLTHKLRAYKDVYIEGTRTALPYEDFFKDLDDDSMLAIIREDQEAWAPFT